MWCNLNVDCWGGEKKKKNLSIKRHLKFTQHVEGTKSTWPSFREKEAAVMNYSFEF